MSGTVKVLGGPTLTVYEQTSLLAVYPTTTQVEVLTIGIAGPPGPAGATTIQATAGETLGGHRLVILDTDGKAYYADSSDTSHGGRITGLTTGAASSGSTATLAVAGKVTEPSWSWTPGALLYVGTSGMLTETPPATGFVQQAGYAITATTVALNLNDFIDR